MKNSVREFVAEMRSRSVIRAIVAYSVASWPLLQVADVTFDRLPIPENSMTILIVLVVIGYPVTFVLAWGYEITVRGVVRHEETKGGAPRMAFSTFIVLVVVVSAAAASRTLSARSAWRLLSRRPLALAAPSAASSSGVVVVAAPS